MPDIIVRRLTPPTFAATRVRALLSRFKKDERGNFLVLTAMIFPILLGTVGLGTEAGVWFYVHEKLQNAADAGVMSAALASNNAVTQGRAVVSSYGLVDGVNNVTVTINRPPTSGPNTGQSGAIEIIIRRTLQRMFSGLFKSTPMVVTARSVALISQAGDGCVLALNKTVSSAGLVQGSANVTLIGCSLLDNSNNSSALNLSGSSWLDAVSVSVVGGISGQSSLHTSGAIQTGVAPAPDPYADVANPSPTGSAVTNCCSKKDTTLNPGIYTNGMKLVAGANITLNPGTYYIEGSGLDVAGGASLAGNGVTLVFTSNDNVNYATATINGNANVSLTAPTSGPLAGIAVFGDRNMPLDSSFKFNGGASQSITGAIYLPKGAAQFSGGMNTNNACMQMIADTVTFTGNSYFAINCSGKGTRPINSAAITLVE
jgi:hypothetical protein